MSQDDRAMTDLTAEDTANETAAMWCIRLSEGDLSEAEWAEFDAWLAQPGHADLLQDAAGVWQATGALGDRSEEHTSGTPVTNAHLVCRLLLEKKKQAHISK